MPRLPQRPDDALTCCEPDLVYGRGFDEWRAPPYTSLYIADDRYALLSLPLLLFPRLVLFFAADERELSSRPSRITRSMVSPIVPIPRPDTLTSLEVFMLRSVGFGLIALAAILVFVVVPPYKPVAPGRKAVVTVLAVLGCVTAVVGWNTPLGALSVIMGIGNGIVGCWGWWSIMFGEDDYRFGKYLKNDSRLKRL